MWERKQQLAVCHRKEAHSRTGQPWLSTFVLCPSCFEATQCIVLVSSFTLTKTMSWCICVWFHTIHTCNSEKKTFNTCVTGSSFNPLTHIYIDFRCFLNFSTGISHRKCLRGIATFSFWWFVDSIRRFSTICLKIIPVKVLSSKAFIC